jgi:hypothetical protein
VKVYVYPAGLDGCGYYRLIWPARALAAQGHEVVVVRPSERSQAHLQISGTVNNDVLTAVRVPPDADVIVMQRVTSRFLSQAIPMIRAQGVSIIIDMDDDLSCIHPSNLAFNWLHPRNGTDHNWVNAANACKAASWVTTTTQSLQGVYASHGRGSVLPNMIPKRMLDIPRNDQGAFGWAGFLGSHPDDPRVMGNTVSRLVGEGLKFQMVGNPEGIAKEFRITEEDLNCRGIVDISVWPEELSLLHVGMAPLADSRFNQSKSWLKPLELSAVGVPTVMSPRRDYVRFNALGGGVLANSPKMWYGEVKRLMTDAAWYEEVVNRSKLAATGLTIEGNAYRWAEVWQSVWLNERRQSPNIFYRAAR